MLLTVFFSFCGVQVVDFCIRLSLRCLRSLVVPGGSVILSLRTSICVSRVVSSCAATVLATSICSSWLRVSICRACPSVRPLPRVWSHQRWSSRCRYLIPRNASIVSCEFRGPSKPWPTGESSDVRRCQSESRGAFAPTDLLFRTGIRALGSSRPSDLGSVRFINHWKVFYPFPLIKLPGFNYEFP
jgi:hypothetical protein